MFPCPKVGYEMAAGETPTFPEASAYHLFRMGAHGA